jgi:cytochrome o ubiquinol oxidase subunit II
MRIPPGSRMLALAPALLLWPLAAHCQSVLDARGPVAAADRQIMLNALVIMLAIVVPTLVVAIGFAWWFRAGNRRARRNPDFVYSGRVELLVWSIPLLTILFLSGVIWIGSHRLDPFQPLSSARPLEVQVVSLDWKWLFIYPQQRIATVNELVVPAGVPLHFSLTSGSVMNAFFVPQLGSMVATMTGMVTQLHLQADHPGDYYGESTQYSGGGFSGMHFLVHAVPAADFERWVGGTRASGATLDAQAYAALSRQSVEPKPLTFSGVEASLFDAVVRQQIPPGPGPQGVPGGAAQQPKAGS